MSPSDKAYELLQLAGRDLKAAQILAHASEPQMEAAGFHLQQTAEKALKAWLSARGVTYPKTHDLSLLLGLLEDEGENIETYWPLLELNIFAVQFRYDLSGEGFPEFEQTAKKTEALLRHVAAILTQRPPPAVDLLGPRPLSE